MTNYMLPASAVSLANGRPVTTSLTVADVFEKRHADVLRSIEDVLADCPKEFGQRNFASSSYVNDQNKQQPMAEMTKDGFTLLAMGYTGAKAMAFKVAYIARFNEMEAHLRQSTPTDRLLSTRFLLGFDPAGAMCLQEVPAKAVLVEPDSLADLIRSTGSLLSSALLPKIIHEEADRLEKIIGPGTKARPEALIGLSPINAPARQQAIARPISPIEKARQSVVSYLLDCKDGAPRRDLVRSVWTFRAMTALQREQLLLDLAVEGVIQEVEYKSRTRTGKRLVLSSSKGAKTHG